MEFKLFLLYTISIFLHLGNRIPALGTARIDLLLVLTLLILVLKNQQGHAEDSKLSDSDRTIRLFLIYLIVSWPLVEWPGSVIRNGFPQFIKAMVFYWFLVYFIKNEKQLRLFLLVFLCLQIFRILEPVWLHVTTGYWGSRTYTGGMHFMNRLEGAPNDIVNPNGLAFVIVTALIFHHFLTSGLSIRYRLMYFACLPIYLYALLLTASRSGFLALVSFIGVLIWQSKKRFTALALCVALALAIFPFLAPQYRVRYISIFGGYGAQRTTALGRWEGTKVAILSSLKRPIVGHGLGTSAETGYHTYRVAAPAHNLYAEILQELGLIGLFIFIKLIYSMFKDIRKIRKQISQTEYQNPFIVRSVKLIFGYLILNILFSLASYGLSKYQWYLCAGIIVVLLRISNMNEKMQGENYR